MNARPNMAYFVWYLETCQASASFISSKASTLWLYQKLDHNNETYKITGTNISY